MSGRTSVKAGPKVPTKRPSAGATKATEAGQQTRNTAKAPQRREARPPKGPTGKNPESDHAKAVAVLAKAGLAPGDSFVEQIGGIFRGASIRAAAEKRRGPDVEWADYRAIRSVLERLRLTSESGNDLRERILSQPPLRYLQDNKLIGHDVYVARLVGYDVTGDMKEGFRVVVPPAAKESATGKRGRPVEVGIEHAMRFAALPAYSLGWQVCAAAVFISKASNLCYAFIERSFRDWARRHKAARA